MQSVIDTFREQLQKQQLPMVEFQRIWVETMEVLLETEMAAMQQYMEAWFALSRSCLHSGDESNPMDMGKQCADVFCELNKLMLEHAHKRQQMTQDWRERMTQIL